MKQTRLAKAIATAVAGSVLSLGVVADASAHTMYNTYNAGTAPTAGGTDGWVYGYVNETYPTVSPGWVGTESATTLPFGYTGLSALNWAAELHNAGASLEISRADALARYGVAADIDTARGAWIDTEETPQGWAHNTDIGLFMSHVDAYVTLNLTADNAEIANFGITVFTGMDTGTDYTHHKLWNSPAQGFDFTANDPFDTTGLNYLTHDATVDGVNGLTFLAEAGQIYSIYLGGSGGAEWNQNKDNYTLTISSSPVPIPAAVWLFGSALAGVGFAGRRPRKAAAA
ncbi:hypothetical protein sS8_0373 [Methylocaldum marinum]|uniref:Uncharacterized protein n=1 Tax=Methylocaldum marinum TaxID=1432792 RepID=A0A286P3W9_9GAMM|nr:VPLPA-CTERM sorting domain-containing protein [Methylocaldum marinum]BBA32341.1 hypothetical protein sS8_0373 [Methylocaldum marinum]